MAQIKLNRKKDSLNPIISLLVLVLSLLITTLPHPLYAEEFKQKTFMSPEEAVTALIDAVKGNDIKKMLSVLGSEGKEIISSGDEVADRSARERFVQLFAEMNRLENEDEERVILSVGNDDWPMPIPVVKKNGQWFFDTKQGKEEILNRRIGRNELDVIDVCKAYIDAQREYTCNDWDNNGVLEFAQKLGSDKGKWNGLYWKAAEDEIQSPFGPLIAKAVKEGYSVSKEGEIPEPYRGYYYKILKAQGSNAPGGAYNYVINGHMVAGYAMVAYPAEYGNSGIMTFIVNQNGIIYEKDLGKNTANMAKGMAKFDPDKTWRKME